ncbi:hypothetical protein B566_EDAN019379 [Ephemera danica]|nr:hypothetical protein B566_EDAN019379 [Ephemera danica]
MAGYANLEEIAILSSEGEINTGKGSAGVIGSDKFVEELRKLRDDKNIKAIVLRINSPGGSSLASDIMWNEVQQTKKVKPVIASFGDYAASGGYYMGMGTDAIVAQPTTITGSIGIFMILFNAQGFMNNKMGITTDQVSTNAHSTFPSVTNEMSAFEKQILQNSTNEGYETFTTKAAAGRHMAVNKLKSIASGRVWSGIQAKQNGLIDEIGGIDAAIALAAKKAKLKTGDYSIKYAYNKKSAFEELFSMDTEEAETNLDVSALSLHKMLQVAEKMDALEQEASVVALSYIAAQRSFPDYTDMAQAKAMLESIARSYGARYGKLKGVRPGSLKAINCIDGYHMLIDFCESENVPYELTGKVVVATKAEQTQLLNNLYERGLQNKLEGIKKISAGEVKEYEPHVQCVEGMWVPQTGIVDYKVVSQIIAKKLKELGVELNFNTKVTGVAKGSTLNIVTTNKGAFEAKLVINCAGLYSDKVAQMSQSEPIDIRIVPFRGEYFKIKPEKHYLVKNLIYPVPDPNFPFLGVHFTRMMRGGIEAGPNAVLAFQREGYKKSQINLKELYETLIWPGFQKVAIKYWQTGMGEMYRRHYK